MKNEAKSPAFETRLNHIRCTVWENNHDGRVWHSTNIIRRYKDGTEYKDSTAFNGLADLCLVAEAVALARDFIRQRQAELQGSGVGEEE